MYGNSKKPNAFKKHVVPMEPICDGAEVRLQSGGI